MLQRCGIITWTVGSSHRDTMVRNSTIAPCLFVRRRIIRNLWTAGCTNARLCKPLFSETIRPIGFKQICESPVKKCIVVIRCRREDANNLLVFYFFGFASSEPVLCLVRDTSEFKSVCFFPIAVWKRGILSGKVSLQFW